MKKMLYLNLNFRFYRNKTLAQMKAFLNRGYATDLLLAENNVLKLYNFNGADLTLENEIKLTSNSSSKRRYYKEMSEQLIGILDKNLYELIYIRRLYLPVMYFDFENMRKRVKVVYEIPTYPFDKLKNKKAGIKQALEATYFNLGGYKNFDLIVTMLQNEAKLFPNMLPVSNGIDIDKYDISKRQVRKKRSNELRLVGIAQLCYWHGYDRIVRAMAVEKNLDVTFTIYSPETAETQVIERYAQEHNLANRVKILEYKAGMDIVNEINKYDLAIGGIGYFRRNAVYDTSLKNKEYCALGIPFVTASVDQSFPANFKYQKMIDGSDTDVNLSELNAWYENIKNEQFTNYMYDYAKNNLTFNIAIDKVLHQLGLL